MAVAPVTINISSNGGPVRSGGMVQGSLSYLSSTTQGMHPVISPNYFRKVLGMDSDRVLDIINGTSFQPKRCRKRRGGPRSKIFCNQFAVGEHTDQIGQSSTGRWYTWRNDDFREQS